MSGGTAGTADDAVGGRPLVSAFETQADAGERSSTHVHCWGRSMALTPSRLLWSGICVRIDGSHLLQVGGAGSDPQTSRKQSGSLAGVLALSSCRAGRSGRCPRGRPGPAGGLLLVWCKLPRPARSLARRYMGQCGHRSCRDLTSLGEALGVVVARFMAEVAHWYWSRRVSGYGRCGQTGCRSEACHLGGWR